MTASKAVGSGRRRRSREAARQAVDVRFTHRSTGSRVAPRWICGSWGRSRFASGIGPSSWAPASSGPYSRCSPWSRAERFRPTTRGRTVGRRTTAERREDGAALRLASAATARRRRRRIVTRGRGYELQLLDGEVDATRFRAPARRVARPRGARAVARRATGRPGGRAVRRCRDPPAGGATAARDGDGDRRRPRGRSARRADRGARGAGVGESAERAPARAANARAVPRRAPVRGAGRVPRRARDARRGDRGGAGRRLRRLHEAILTQDPELDLPAPAVPAAALRPLPRRRSRAVLAGAAAILLAGVTAFGVIRLVEPDSLPGIDEDHVGVSIPTAGASAPSTPSAGPRGRSRPGRARCGWPTGSTARSRASTWSRQVVTIRSAARRRRWRSARARCGSRTATPARSAGRPGREQGRSSGSRSGTRRARSPRRAGACGSASGVDGRVQRIDLHRGRSAARSRSARTRRRVAAGAGALWVASEEAGTVDADRAADRYASSGRSTSATGQPRSRSARARSGSSTVATARCRGSTPPQRGSRRRTVSAGAERRRRRRRGGLGGGRQRRGPSSASIPGGRGAVDRIRRAAALPRSRSRTGRCGRGARPGGQPTAAGRCAWRLSGRASVNWLRPQRLRLEHGDHPLAYDGLVAYRRVDGAAGATLVGALATTCRRPSADGRTYVFTLRPGLRYSDGRPVRARGLPASMERLLRVNRSPAVLRGDRGRGACIRRPARCDLSRGIETDPVARHDPVHRASRTRTSCTS